MTFLNQQPQTRSSGLAGRLAGLVFFLVGLVMLGIAVLVGIYTATWLASLQRVEGTVVAIQRMGSSARPIVEARMPEGGTIRVVGAVATSPWPVVGTVRELGYPAGRPGEAAVLDTFTTWFVPGILGFLGLIFTFVGALVMIFGARTSSPGYTRTPDNWTQNGWSDGTNDGTIINNYYDDTGPPQPGG